MARTPRISPTGENSAIAIKARVLVGCALGKPNDVVEIAPEQVASLDGMIDASPEAVAYAESLTK